jgi:hypothetical protein
MGISVKLGHYTADEEVGSTPARLALVLAGVAALVTLGVIVIALLSHEEGKGEARALSAQQQSDATSVEAAFRSTNWGRLEAGSRTEPPKTLDTDYDAPEWQDYDVFRELKAMAVYEIKSSGSSAAEQPTEPERIQNTSGEK